MTRIEECHGGLHEKFVAVAVAGLAAAEDGDNDESGDRVWGAPRRRTRRDVLEG